MSDKNKSTVDPVEEIKTGLNEIKTGINDTKTKLTQVETNVTTLTGDVEEIRSEMNKFRKSQLANAGKRVLSIGVVSVECASFLGAMAICNAEMQGKLQSHHQREALVGKAKTILGMEAKAALTTTDIPMPVDYASEVIELVYIYGQFRKYATVYPLGTVTTKLPRLKTSPAFGFVAASAAVPEKSPQVEFVTFTANKAGGIVRIPSELDADSIVPLGQFIARYIAREMAKWEDTVGYLGDGSGTYLTIKGIGKYCVDNAMVLQLAATKTKPTDITLDNLRLLRAKPTGAVLGTAAYYMHPTMEALLSTFNTSATVTPYIANGPGGPTLDGFPIRWINVLPVYDSSAHVSQVQVLFGDHSYWFLGERSGVSIETSNHVYFNTDEVGIRALERFDVQAMATDAMAALQLAAS